MEMCAAGARLRGRRRRFKRGAAGEREGALWVVRCGCGDGGGDRAKFARGRWTLRLSACFARRVRTRARGKPAELRRRCG